MGKSALKHSVLSLGVRNRNEITCAPNSFAFLPSCSYSLNLLFRLFLCCIVCPKVKEEKGIIISRLDYLDKPLCHIFDFCAWETT